MIKTTAMLLEELKGYGSPKSKLARMAERGECFPITRGLYETDRNAPAYLLAGSIYGPSYISFEYALSRYGLIPEAVYAVTCATFEKKKKKKYETPFGTFTYRMCHPRRFRWGFGSCRRAIISIGSAEPEKALCDQLYTMPPVPNTQELFRLLTEDLRIEESEIGKLDGNKVCEYSGAYHTTNIKKLCSLLRRL